MYLLAIKTKQPPPLNHINLNRQLKKTIEIAIGDERGINALRLLREKGRKGFPARHVHDNLVSLYHVMAITARVCGGAMTWISGTKGETF